MYNWFKIDIHQQLRPLTANYLAMVKVISTTIYRDLIRLLNEMDIGIKANKHYNETNTYTSSSSWSDLLVSVLCLHPF